MHAVHPAPPRTISVEWETLQPGTTVQLVNHSETTLATESANLGTVDLAMPDGSAVWIWLRNGLGRIMVHQSDGAQIFVIPGWA